MGMKQFHIHRRPPTIRSGRYYMSRADLRKHIADCFAGSNALPNLLDMTDTVERVGWGTWFVKNSEHATACGCPLASIAVQVDPILWKEDYTDVESLGGYGNWDGLLHKLSDVRSGVVYITD